MVMGARSKEKGKIMIRTDHTRHIFGRYGEPHRMRDYAYRPLADLDFYGMLFAACAQPYDPDTESAYATTVYEVYGNHR